MSGGGLTDPVTPKRLPFYEDTAQGATAKELRESLKNIPDDAKVVWVDSFEEEVTYFGQVGKVTAGIGFKWTVDA